jgi:hypothetical protein
MEVFVLRFKMSRIEIEKEVILDKGNMTIKLIELTA